MDLKDQGKIRAIGVSNVSLDQLDAYRKAGDLASDQFRYSMILRDREADILPYCEENNIATLTYWSLEQGLPHRQGRAGPRVQGRTISAIPQANGSPGSDSRTDNGCSTCLPAGPT